jgi:hypothetical protein
MIYATTSQAPGDLFTIDGGSLLPVKEKREILLELKN